MYEIFTRYIEEILNCNYFLSAENNTNQVLSDVFFFRNETDEQIEQNLREEVKSENYEEEYNSRRKQYQTREEEVLRENT